MKKTIKGQQIDQIKIDFVKLCAAVAAKLPVEAIESPIRTPDASFARFLVMNYFRQTTKFSFAVIGTETFNKDHSTVSYAVKKCQDLEDIQDKQFIEMKTEFYKLINTQNMKQLLEEAERREALRTAKSDEKKKQLDDLHRYVRTYRKAIAKLIRTEEKPPSKRDFDLLNHILNY